MYEILLWLIEQRNESTVLILINVYDRYIFMCALFCHKVFSAYIEMQ